MSAVQADVYQKREAVDSALDPRQTESKLSLALDAIVNGKSHAEKSAGSYLDVLLCTLGKLPVIQNRESAFDTRIMSTIDSSKKFLNEYRSFVDAIANADNADRFLPQLTVFLEGILDIKKHHEFKHTEAYLWRDALSFMAREIFLCTVAPLCAGGRWSLVQGLLSYNYNVAQSQQTFSYQAFDGFQRSLDVFRNRRLKLNRVSVSADVLKERVDESSFDFEQVMQADFILHIYSLMQGGLSADIWFARTLGHADEQLVSGFDAFVLARAGKSSGFLKELFDVADWSQLQASISAAATTTTINFPDSLDYQGFIAANTAIFDH